MKPQHTTSNPPDILVAFLVFLLCVLIALFAPESVSTLSPPEGLG
jgi:hypothetical protein